MKFRLSAFGLHLLGSAAALSLILGGLWLGWYRWPGWYLTGVVRVVAILAIVDLALGPALTAIVANPRKPRRELARDIGVIVTVQLIALGCGAVTLWLGRPLYYAFSVDRLQMVQASDVPSAEGARPCGESRAGGTLVQPPAVGLGAATGRSGRGGKNRPGVDHGRSRRDRD